jgi:hypothetical protein
MDDRSVKRALGVMSNLLKNSNDNSTAMAGPIQRFINRFVKLMSEKKEIDFK